MVLHQEQMLRDFKRNTRVILNERYTDHARKCSLRKLAVAYTTGKVGLYVRLVGYSVRIGRGPEIITGDGIQLAVPADCLVLAIEEKPNRRRTMSFYPATFIAAVKAEMKDNPALYNALDHGLDEIVHSFLKRFERPEVLAEEVLILIGSGRTRKLVETCERLQRLQGIYREWATIYAQIRRKPHRG